MLRLGVAVPAGVLIAPDIGGMRAAAIEGQVWGAATSPFAPQVGRHAGRAVLALEAGVNGGFEHPAFDTACFSAGVVWAAPGAEARTLLAVRQGRGSNYLYLTEAADRSVSLQDDAGGLLLTLPPAPGGVWQAVLFGRSGDRYSLRRVGGAVVSARAALDLPDRAGLLIGCRALRQGLARSLGAGMLAEVMLWPFDATVDDTAVAHYLEWNY